MRRFSIIVALVAILLVPGVAGADGGSYTDAQGLSCTWHGSQGIYQAFCAGYSTRSNRFYQYSCDYYVYPGGSMQWYCHDINGRAWQGSR